MIHTINLLTPIFISIAFGYIAGKWRNLPPGPFVSAVMDIFMPALVFGALLTEDISGAVLIDTGLSAAIIAVCLFVLCLLCSKLFSLPLNIFSLPVLFMNSGILGIPLIKILYGPGAVGGIVMYDQIQSLFIFTLGIFIALSARTGVTGSGKNGLSIFTGISVMFKEPLVYAIVIALIIKTVGIQIPGFIITPVLFVGDVTPAIALFSLGIRLATVPLRPSKILVLIVFMRFIFGFVCGIFAVYLLDLEGVTAATVIIASTLPAAVFNFIIAERYNCHPELTATAVFVTTLFAIPLLPLFIHITGKLTGVWP